MTPFVPGDVVRLAPQWRGTADGELPPALFEPHTVESIDIRAGTTDYYLKLFGAPSTWRSDRFEPVVDALPVEDTAAPSDVDPVNHPAHYAFSNGVEVIDLTEQLDFLRGNAVKYLARAGRKDGVDELEDLRKAQWYVDRAVIKLDLEREQAGK